MTTETICVPRDELLELLQDGVDDYWITTEDGARIVEILRASLAQSVIPDWRAYSAQFARGEKCPETLETLQAAWTRDQELIFDQKAQISRIKETVNDLRQKLAAQPVASEPVAWQTGSITWGYEADARNHARDHRMTVVALYLHPPAPAIPDGYVLVPIEPTQKMLEAGWVEERDIQQNEDTAWDFRSCNRLLNIYRAMIAIAQQPTTEGSTDE